MSFLPHYCHSFRITAIPSGFLSFLPDFLSFLPYQCHSFRILSFLPNYYNFKYFSSLIAPVPSHTRRARKMATGGGHICEYIIKIPHNVYINYEFRTNLAPLVHIFSNYKKVCGFTNAKVVMSVNYSYLNVCTRTVGRTILSSVKQDQRYSDPKARKRVKR